MMQSSSDGLQEILINGQIELKGEFLWGSNYTFLTEIKYNRQTIAAVYKPIRGERPLWDFPAASLAKREVAAFILSEALGWGFVPTTVYRQDAPLGSGSLQLFIEHDPEYHYFNFKKDHLERLRPVVIFDALVNNGDRKGSHILIDPKDGMWLIDHGVCFHVQDKLRTVIWDFSGETIPGNLLSDLVRLQALFKPNDNAPSDVVKLLGSYLNQDEIEALEGRLIALVGHGCFPEPHPDRRHFPWPQI